MQSQVRFNRVLAKVPEKVWEALAQSQVRFNGIPEKVLEQVPGGFGAEPGQVQRFRRRFRRRPGRLWCRARSGSTGFWRRFRRRSGRLWRRARLGSTGFQRRFWSRFREALVQSQVRFNGSGEGSGEGLGGFGAEPGQVQQGSGEGSGEGLGGFGAEPG